ncbi:delta(1)-pyrroline-2-carboxylate reductase [Plakobranchus ocellatus]|uniref:Delta(1)-pyrroline-2-carboxylate reductase n=1 Tax=Plakobranchus ocellatus TaxID=259542 RepID=A0AAV4ATZ1_9GAST|nr:delta(1)-pyrroline-2-carboxylate reductase [Plakobranchus ocellatus]
MDFKLEYYYLTDLHKGFNAKDKEPEILKQTPATALVHGNNCVGPVVGKFCMDLAIEKAKNVGIGWVCVKASNHFGIAGWYSIRAMEQGLIGMAFCNTSPFMIPTRSKTRTLGTNPISVAAKGNNGEEFVLDMATTAVAQGKVEIKNLLGKKVPQGWTVDGHGKPCTDPQEVLDHGGLHPLGGPEETSGYKGYGLGFMVELFCGILSGSRFGQNIRTWSCHEAEADLGQCFAAIDPSVFAPGFEGRLSDLIHQCKDQEPVEGETEILVPGDPEKNHIELCTRLGGIPYHSKQIAFADELAEKYGVERLHRL